MNIPEAASLLPNQLSGGMRQRVALARALIAQPDILLLDEPFAAVDQINRQSLIAELNQLRDLNKQTLILVTHDMEEALFLADRIIVLGQTPANICQILEVPKLPDNWQAFYCSSDVARLKAHLYQLLQENSG